MSIRFSPEEFSKLKELLLIYEWGLRTLHTKLKIIHEDFKNFHEDNPIDHIRKRIKAPESIAEKLHRQGYDITADSAKAHIWDIAGIRIICPFSRDIYHLIDLLRSMPDITILEERDYINEPKPSGYRSYHLIAEISIFHSGQTDTIPVEIQIRTEAMNFWATLEHEAKYKYEGEIPAHLSNELVTCADQIAALDHRMFLIHENILGRSNEITKEMTHLKKNIKAKKNQLRNRTVYRSSAKCKK